MNEEQEETFKLMDIMRYAAPIDPPEGTPQKVLDTICEHSSEYLFDIYLLANGVPIRALLHPSMYLRVLKGWLRVGSVVKILELEKDMIVQLEPTGEISKSDLTKIKKEAYITLPSPIYNPKAYYMPLLSDEGYMRWDRRWKRYLEEYSNSIDDKEILLEKDNKSLKDGHKKKAKSKKDLKNIPVVVCSEESEEEERPFKRKMPANRLGYSNTSNNFITGQVILKSKLFKYQGHSPCPLMFSFVLLTKSGLVKAYVWESAVRKFFCVDEGNYIAIRGFKIKRRTGSFFAIGDRMKTDTDTKYANIPEINVNITSPVGQIMRIDPISDLFCPEKDSEFTTVVGTVEYISPLMREKEAWNAVKLREYVLLKVSGVVVKLVSNGCAGMILDIKAGLKLEIRHLRKATIGSFVFYISSVYTQFYIDGTDAPLFDKTVIAKNCTAIAEENAMGYIPVCFSTFSEHMHASKEGVGALSLNGVPIEKGSSNAGYIARDLVYFGELLNLASAEQKIDALYMDETIRIVIYGKILAVKYNSLGDTTIGENSFDVSYVATEATMSEIKEEKTEKWDGMAGMAFNDKIEENIVIRVGDESSNIDLQIFQNHLVHSTFEESVQDFLKMGRIMSHSIYNELSKRVGEKYYFVFDAVRVNEEVILKIGVSLLAPPTGMS
ncbi:hypothetical protein NEMIN01_0183 [Nematocida minor]|uniref:uncharacterized protein n=1 Tax=Nematocida minor TaxID=1912983 RepID=UPI0022211955|nr:uncharacterized protein NEMIN01_0079 [Nematocida minor]XP_051332085.1 uncharacterized protein NEMIN01_0183 [Nematocida minor]KAI5188815.1 hypothetical protein NEMIN01_0079 [Nematocida minor]KAI5188919.1 hypothetical protein NEMIN01_0183 [Nematocida minor]